MGPGFGVVGALVVSVVVCMTAVVGSIVVEFEISAIVAFRSNIYLNFILKLR